MPAPATCLFVACLAAAVTALAAAAGAWLARGTTAVPAAVWAVAAAVVLAVETGWRAAGGLADPAAAAAVRLVAAALAVCPTMALLGATRPQHGVWQFIVGTLAVVLAFPAVAATLVRPGTFPDVHMLGRCFLLALVVVGWLNFVATRHGAAATLVAAGQVALVRGFLPLAAPAAGPADPAVDAAGSLLVALGALLAAGQSVRPPVGPAGRRGLAGRFDPVYLAVRETLGAAWALRLAERFDAIAVARGWPCRLRFGGLEGAAAEDEAVWHRDALRVFRALLRRFVSPAWLRRQGWK
jgi:hypothetical protein